MGIVEVDETHVTGRYDKRHKISVNIWIAIWQSSITGLTIGRMTASLI